MDGVKSLPELTIENTTVAAVAFANAIVSEVVCAVPLLVKAVVESEALLNVTVVVVAVTSVVFLQLAMPAKNNINAGIITFFMCVFLILVI